MSVYDCSTLGEPLSQEEIQEVLNDADMALDGTVNVQVEFKFTMVQIQLIPDAELQNFARLMQSASLYS